MCVLEYRKRSPDIYFQAMYLQWSRSFHIISGHSSGDTSGPCAQRASPMHPCQHEQCEVTRACTAVRLELDLGSKKYLEGMA
jgi:hypothetical protein